MISGMTGYASHQILYENRQLLIELKSYNHRYLDIVVNLPKDFEMLEEFIVKSLKTNAFRGKIYVSVHFLNSLKKKVIIQQDVLESMLSLTDTLSEKYQIKNDLSLSDLLRLPNVLHLSDVEFDKHGLCVQIQDVFAKKILKEWIQMRKEEGKSLKKHLGDVAKNLVKEVKTIQSCYQKELKKIQQNNTNQDCSTIQKGIAIDEEIIRLQHYIQSFKDALKLKVAIGKRMDFIAQEMLREVNTIGSKAEEQSILDCVVNLKSNIENIREQSHNVE